MGRLGKWTLQHACAEALFWPDEIKLTVNISPAQFRGEILFDNILCVLVETGFSPQRLELEVTESMLLQDREENLILFRSIDCIGRFRHWLRLTWFGRLISVR
jgi:EAL domain-containing protein (putative c-di-GMP-specific phosphodiesterase class I)